MPTYQGDYVGVEEGTLAAGELPIGGRHLVEQDGDGSSIRYLARLQYPTEPDGRMQRSQAPQIGGIEGRAQRVFDCLVRGALYYRDAMPTTRVRMPWCTEVSPGIHLRSTHGTCMY